MPETKLAKRILLGFPLSPSPLTPMLLQEIVKFLPLLFNNNLFRLPLMLAESGSNFILEEFLISAELNSTMEFFWLDWLIIMELGIGLFKILGELAGDRMDTLNSLWETLADFVMLPLMLT